MRKLIIILATVAIIVPTGLWWTSPEQVLKRRTEHLMDVLSLSRGSTAMLRQNKVFSLGCMVAEELEIVSPGIPRAEGSFRKEIVESAFSWVCRNARESEFKVIRFRAMAIGEERAVVMLEVEGFMRLPAYRPVDGIYEVTIDWIKAEDGWRFEKIIWEPRTL